MQKHIIADIRVWKNAMNIGASKSIWLNNVLFTNTVDIDTILKIEYITFTLTIANNKIN